MPTPHHPSIAVRRALRKLGLDIREARRRRGLPAQIIAQRAFTSRPTLRRIEAGDHGVSIGIYAAVLQAIDATNGQLIWEHRRFILLQSLLGVTGFNTLLYLAMQYIESFKVEEKA